MPDYLPYLLGILFAMVIMTLLSGLLAKYVVRISQYLKISDILIAVLLLGLIGSIGELNIAITSMVIGFQELVAGLVIGVTIAMIMLVGGISACYNKGIPATSFNSKRTLTILNFIVVLFIVLLSDGTLSSIDGLILIFLFPIYLMQIKDIKSNIQIQSFKALTSRKDLISLSAICLLIIVNLFFTAGFAMQNVYYLERYSQIGLFIIGLAIIAPFSVIPELLFELELSRKGTSKTAISDLITSSITNLTLIIGLVAFFKPFTVTNIGALSFNLFVLAVIILVFNIYFHTKRMLDKKEGIVMIFVFFVYLLLNFLLFL